MATPAADENDIQPCTVCVLKKANSTVSDMTEWKLTLLDSTNHDPFDVSASAVSTTTAIADVNVNFPGAKDNTNDTGATNNGVFCATSTGITTLTVNYAPEISTRPTDRSVILGDTATFSVVATGNPAPSYQWEYNDGNSWTEISSVTEANHITANIKKHTLQSR